jgi:hypothetical protein
MYTSSDLLCNFEDDIKFYRHPERKAGNADYHPHRCFLDAKDIPNRSETASATLGWSKKSPEVADEHSEPDDATHSIE